MYTPHLQMAPFMKDPFAKFSHKLFIARFSISAQQIKLFLSYNFFDNACLERHQLN